MRWALWRSVMQHVVSLWNWMLRRSRLGCQIIAKKDIDGIKVAIPSATRNFAVDGFKPKPH
eukprot:3515052-Pyramimonas_sp.AAC.1